MGRLHTVELSKIASFREKFWVKFFVFYVENANYWM